ITSYLREKVVTGKSSIAYLRSFRTDQTHTPSGLLSYNSTGKTNTVKFLGTGRYEVIVRGQSLPGGHVQITSYGNPAHYCKVQSWTRKNNNTHVFVRCFRTTGALTNSLFSLLYSKRSPSGGNVGGYVWANNLTSSSYTPPISFQYNSLYPAVATTQNTAGKNNSTGSYWVKYPKIKGKPSTALVTAYGANSDYCKIRSWSALSTDAKVNVQCFNRLGNPVNARFNQLLMLGRRRLLFKVPKKQLDKALD
ncbi:MAG: hypothetical protein AAGJ35_06505, partial [Myxococcota bacterium]